MRDEMRDGRGHGSGGPWGPWGPGGQARGQGRQGARGPGDMTPLMVACAAANAEMVFELVCLSGGFVQRGKFKSDPFEGKGPGKG